MADRYDTGEGNLRRWYEDPERPALYLVLRHVWPHLDDQVKHQIIVDAAGGGDDPWAGVDFALYEAAHRGIRVPDRFLDMLDADLSGLPEKLSIPESVEVLRTMNRIAA